jgi:hypothetical protein
MAVHITEFPSLLTASHAEATKPVPSTSTSGVALANSDGAGWRRYRENVGFPMGVVMLTADGNATLTGPVYLYGYDDDTSAWYRIGTLNSGQDIALTSTVGYAEQFNFPAVFDRLAISATVSANNVNDRYMPLTSNK